MTLRRLHPQPVIGDIPGRLTCFSQSSRAYHRERPALLERSLVRRSQPVFIRATRSSSMLIYAVSRPSYTEKDQNPLCHTRSAVTGIQSRHDPRCTIFQHRLCRSGIYLPMSKCNRQEDHEKRLAGIKNITPQGKVIKLSAGGDENATVLLSSSSTSITTASSGSRFFHLQPQ